MFANILGTLTKFKNEAQHKSEAEIKREQIDQKLQEKLKRERDELSSKMRREEEQRRAKLIEQKRLDEERKINEVVCIILLSVYGSGEMLFYTLIRQQKAVMFKKQKQKQKCNPTCSLITSPAQRDPKAKIPPR